MKSSNTPERFSSPPVLDLVGIAENFTFQADPVGLLRELLISAGMTLQNPAGIMAANARLLWGSAAAFRATVERALGYDRPGPIAIPRGDKKNTVIHCDFSNVGARIARGNGAVKSLSCACGPKGLP